MSLSVLLLKCQRGDGHTSITLARWPADNCPTELEELNQQRTIARNTLCLATSVQAATGRHICASSLTVSAQLARPNLLEPAQFHYHIHQPCCVTMKHSFIAASEQPRCPWRPHSLEPVSNLQHSLWIELMGKDSFSFRSFIKA